MTERENSAACIFNPVFSRQLFLKKDIQDIFDGKQRNKERRDELRANGTAFCRMHFFFQRSI